MKAHSTIVELAETALPIFGDSERDYDHLSRIVSHRPIEGGIEAEVESHEERVARARLTFVTPEIVRVQYVLDREPPATTPMLAGPLPASPAVQVREEDGAIEVVGPSLRLRVDKQQFRWALLDGPGTPIVAQEVKDGGLGQHIAFPAGWSHRPGEGLAFHETLGLRPDEQLYGLGESFGPLNRRGTRSVAWSRDTHGTSTTPLTYLSIPFFISTRGYGMFVNQTARAVYELGFPSQVSSSFRVEQPYLDYFVIHGPTPQQIIERYWQLTGRAGQPPLWSFGVWMSRCMYRDAEQVHAVVDRLRELEIPLDVIHIDPRWLEVRKHHQRDGCDFVWDRAAFGEPEAFVESLCQRGVRLSLWENPYVWRDTAMYEEGKAKGYFALGPDGEPAPSLENPAEAVVVDFTNPEAFRWWQDKHRPYLRAGVAGFKPDYGEAVPKDARFSDGTTGIETHNVYPLLYNKAVWEAIQEERGEAMLFSRSGYAGSQRYPLNWVGDTQCTWEGMAAALRAGLSLSLSGIAFWAHDIGGFWNPGNPAQGPDPDLYIRWAQWGLLSSHSRFHGVRGREPWWYGDEAIDVVRRFARLRYRLLPYLWSCAHEAIEQAAPMMRPLVFAYPDDPTAWHIDTEYLLGPSLLVAPVFDPSGRVRVYLPPGRWFDFWSGEAMEGSRWLDMTMPLDTLPLYVRDDSLLPFGPEQTYVGEKPWSPVQIDVRVSGEASLRVDGEGARIDVRARRDGDGVDLELSGSVPELVLRFLSPAATSAEASGDASDIRQERIDNVVTLSMRLDGSARVRAR